MTRISARGAAWHERCLADRSSTNAKRSGFVGSPQSGSTSPSSASKALQGGIVALASTHAEPKRRRSTLARKLGVGALAVFFVKGLAWLVVAWWALT